MRMHWRNQLKALAALVLLGGLQSPVAPAALAEAPVRPPLPSGPSSAPLAMERLGLWLTTVDSAVMYDSAESHRAVQFLLTHGFKRASVPLQTGGQVLWPVRAQNNLLGMPLDPRLPHPISTGVLIGALNHSGIETVGWFEFGLMAPAEAPWLAGREHLLLRDQAGQTTWLEGGKIKRVWLNPALAEVRDGLTALVVDACKHLPLAAIQFDDHLGYPATFGYDPTTLALWRSTAAGARQPTPAPDDPAWIAWRSSWITSLLAQIRSAMAQYCPGIRLSVAPNPQEFSYSNYLANWGDWVQRGLVDEVVVQIYRNDPAALRAELADPTLRQAAARLPLRIGLLAGLKNQPKAPAQLLLERQIVQEQGLAGIDLFFYESARPHFGPPL
jgi:uncharacterized lipoprotein YddW (UPF0748 family)